MDQTRRTYAKPPPAINLVKLVLEKCMPHAGTLAIANLKKFYPVDGRDVAVLDDISLDISPGEFVAVVGSSGCGKSTLLRLLIGLDRQYEGEILLDGKRVVGTGLERGIVFQEHRLFPWLTVTENIAVGLHNKPGSTRQKRAIVGKHIELVGLQGFELAYPHQLSGGMAQRVAIARALVNRPEILLLDEPFGALDPHTRSHLQQELQRIWQQEGITMVLVTHDVDEALFLADRVVVMQPRPGRIRDVLPVPLARPRERNSSAFLALRDQVLAQLVQPS
jgi:ABC-type nitrate/sulfonate/bicarbonate transport system ATPase subunit